MTQAESPIALVIGCAVRDPIGMVRKSEEVRPKLLKTHFLMNRYAVIEDVQVRLLEIDNAFASRILYIGISNVPFEGHGPVEHLSPRRNFVHCDRDKPLQSIQRLSKAVSSNTPANRVEFSDQCMHFMTENVEIHSVKRRGDRHFWMPCLNPRSPHKTGRDRE